MSMLDKTNNEETYKSWINLPHDTKKTTGQLLKIGSFWYPMVLQRQRVNNTTRWAMHIGFIDPIESELNLKHLSRIEVLEAIFRALDKGCVNMDKTRHLIWISNKLNLLVPEALEDALQWLERTGEYDMCQRLMDLGSKELCFITIQYIFAEYCQFIQSMGKCAAMLLKALTRHHNAANALKYLKAVGDGKRAVLIDPMWAKGHYRYSEALFCLNEYKWALQANEYAQSVPKGTNPNACAALRTAVQDGYGALADLRCWLAEKAFSQALGMLQTTTLKDLGISTLDEALLRYGRASALIEIGQPQELGEALKEFGIIKSLEKRTFQCLVYYGIGRVYFKENRFKDALTHFSDSMQMVDKRIIPGKLTWPLTKEVVKETQLDYFKELLLEVMESCQFPPMPDAICRHGNGIGHIKTAIYFTDPDFKGFIRLACSQGCVVEYHISCWKSFKTTSFSDTNEKDFLQRDCFTPDCKGAVCSIQIYGSTGLIKCKFETVIKKAEHPKKFRVIQKCTSLKNLESKAERKLRRKQAKQASKDRNIADGPGHPSPRAEEPDAVTGNKHSQEAGLLALRRDRVLFQIKQHRELLGEHPCPDLGALVARLRPWVELDVSKGNAVAARFMGAEQARAESLGQLADLLLERRNRVWARVFVEFLGSSLKWARQLDDDGLSAATVFIETYAGHLEEMDPSCLLNFAPLQDVLVKKFESRPELLSQSGIGVVEYLRRAPVQDVRLFIWTLEEHRDHYNYCHTILDEFFEILDGDCLVMKRSDNVNENSSPVKTRNRGRKKKVKDQKTVIVLSGMRGSTQRDEQDFSGDNEDTLSFYQPSDDPFSVPDHMRDRVACFESQFNPTPDHKSVLDNNPDTLTQENIYDYFAQILEEHGPLGAQDPLLLGQLDHFPAEARQRILRSGGLTSLLLRSPHRFVVMGERVGLAKHTGSLRDTASGGLNDLDDLDDDECCFLDEGFALPCPYLQFGAPESGSEAPGAACVSEEYRLHSGTARGGAEETDNHVGRSLGADLDHIGTPVNNAELGNAQDQRDVAINAEEKKRIQNDLAKDLAEKNKRAITSLQKEIEDTYTNIQVTNKEVELFQQKLEEMVRKDQKEKKANQEELKALKTEIEELAGKRTGLSKSLQEKSKQYDKQLRDFCDLSNQSAAAKLSLEDEIKRCRGVCTEAAARSQKAELSLLENTCVQSLYCLHKSLSDSREILLRIDEVAHRYPAQLTAVFQHRWRSCVQEATEKIALVENQFQQQTMQVRQGTRLSTLPQVGVPSAPEPPVAVLCLGEVPKASPPPPPGQRSRPLEPKQNLNRSDKILVQLKAMFPIYTRQELMKFVHTLRRANGVVLTSMPFHDVIRSVSEIVLDHQAKEADGVWQQSGASSWEVAAPPPASQAWMQLGPQKHSHPKAINMGDPCIICHDDMLPASVCVLQCRHSFHEECIKAWLKEQSTCPTCRKHALLPEDFPLLAGRRNTGRPAPSFS
ncbi:hypothetical protein NHX12_010113 [Muraenolepis orangiensis]|uniref:RING-type E3 ubiquitin transferase n=1 Tax=Muraenolepis orangiensis TaxID=630683 RepID=A0A9Q0DJ54_9TELE|nr:hypothetical protein NHX12_010113 [Muraenolepis orangiensis]